jgi:hypothetical protein
MPFAGLETALRATIFGGGDLTLILGKITRPAAHAGPSTTFQALTRRLNNFRIIPLTQGLGVADD